MNRLNPLYILLSIIIINILTYAFLEDKKDIYFEKIDQSEKLELKIKEYTNVTNFYKNLNFINKTIDEDVNRNLIDEVINEIGDERWSS